MRESLEKFWLAVRYFPVSAELWTDRLWKIYFWSFLLTVIRPHYWVHCPYRSQYCFLLDDPPLGGDWLWEKNFDYTMIFIYVLISGVIFFTYKFHKNKELYTEIENKMVSMKVKDKISNFLQMFFGLYLAYVLFVIMMGRPVP